jgi:hypothetical protein
MKALKIAAMDIAEVAQADDDYFIRYSLTHSLTYLLTHLFCSDDEEDVAEDVEVSATDGTSSKGSVRTGDLYMDAPSSGNLTPPSLTFHFSLTHSLTHSYSRTYSRTYSLTYLLRI